MRWQELRLAGSSQYKKQSSRCLEDLGWIGLFDYLNKTLIVLELNNGVT